MLFCLIFFNNIMEDEEMKGSACLHEFPFILQKVEMDKLFHELTVNVGK